jgi:hypothetical protein
MRKILVILTIIFVILSLVFVILPMGTIAFLPVGLALIFGVLAFIKTESAKRVLPRWLVLISIILLLVSVTKVFVIKDTVEKDEDFEIEMLESTEDAQQELEDIEDLQGLDSSAQQPSQTVTTDSVQQQ